MMIKYPQTKTVQISVVDFQNGLDTDTAENITDFDRAVETYNFDYKSGALTEGIGFEELTLPASTDDSSTEKKPGWQDAYVNSDVVKIVHYKEYNAAWKERTDKLILISGQKYVFFCRIISRLPSIIRLDEVQYQEIPKMFNYTDGTFDCVVFTDEKDLLNSWNGQVESVKYNDAPLIADFCEHKNRVFAVIGGERLTIRTEPTNLLTWTTTPTEDNINITLDSERGYINKLLSFNGYIFAMRDFGITRITWYESDNSFAVTEILCSGSKMYGNTACICGNKGIVLCRDGLFEFNNVVAKKIDLKLDRILKGVSNSNAVASFKNGVYYLACKLNFNDGKKIGCENGEYKNNALLALNVETNKYSILRGVDICDLCTIQHESVDKLLACFNVDYTNKIGQITFDGKLFGQSEFRLWKTPLTDLGYSDKIKLVKEISLLSKYDIKITVFSDSQSSTFDIKGSNLLTRIPVKVKGKQIGISIESQTEKAYISNLKMTVDLLDTNYV